MAKKAEPSRVAAALQYLQQMRDRAADFGGGVVDTLADRARDVGGLAYEALTSDPNIGRMTTAEYAQAADRPTPRLDQAAQNLGTIGRAIVTQPIQTGKALVQGEVKRAQQAMTSPRAAGEYAGSMVDPMRIAAALRKTAPIAELDVYHGTPHRFPETEANPLGEFDASKVGTGEGAQAYGHGIYLAEAPEVAEIYRSATNPASRKAEMTLQMTSGNVDEAIKFVKKEQKTIEQFKNDSIFNQDSYQKILDTLDYLKQTKKGKKPTVGAFYKADLPDEMIDRMLDWDKPLSEQPEAVRKAFAKADERARFGPLKKNAPILDPEEKHLRGQDAYRALANALSETGVIRRGSTAVDGSDKAVSEYLQQLGIPGIRYLDAGSRGGSGTGTRNFVVFPGEEKKVKILKRD